MGRSGRVQKTLEIVGAAVRSALDEAADEDPAAEVAGLGPVLVAAAQRHLLEQPWAQKLALLDAAEEAKPGRAARVEQKRRSCAELAAVLATLEARNARLAREVRLQERAA